MDRVYTERTPESSFRIQLKRVRRKRGEGPFTHENSLELGEAGSGAA
jgi:hypothetical protein